MPINPDPGPPAIPEALSRSCGTDVASDPPRSLGLQTNEVTVTGEARQVSWATQAETARRESPTISGKEALACCGTAVAVQATGL